ncbi:MAG: ABC transporter substrate-binding protein [Peptoniphilus sp.]|nr:ABC transporter substrate-binding protein [Peptoniphilus sp.]MDD7363567.1 ABC transporter substrate-binding protein [Bacillota bacterium]MDY6044681.1 ABC transporter substrate-binding protein [Peptoniphilus sp.]
MSKKLHYIALGLLTVVLLTACSNGGGAGKGDVDLASLSVEDLEAKAKEEGEVHSVGMPDSWANWEETWKDIETKYGIKHADTDMSSAEELAKFAAEKKNASADIGDVGIAFGPVAEEQGLSLKYKTSYWDDVPDWAKDDDGDWLLAYTGQMCFITDKQNLPEGVEPPKSYKDILDGDYVLTIGDVETGNQDQFALLNAAIEFGGDEKNLRPGLDFFKKLAQEGRLKTNDSSLSNLEAGEVQVGMLWDFNALNYADNIGRDRFEITVPPISVMTGYTTIINRYASNPYAAALAREFILSDEGQDNLAKGYARPIRENAQLSEEAKEKLLPPDAYNEIYRVKDQKAWEETTKTIAQLWQENVVAFLK